MAVLKITLFLACGTLLSCLATADIASIRFAYNPNVEKFPRVKIDASFSSLTAFTLCLWAKPNFSHKEMALFNYGVPGQDKEIFLSLEGKIMHFYVGGRLLLNGSCDGQKPVYWISGAWHHICVTWTPTNSNVRIFVNGIFCSKASQEIPHTVPGVGVMVLGQALKGLDTDFHRNQSWSGDIAGVQMWDEVLGYKQIVSIGRCKRKHEGNVVSWMKTPMIASDEIIFSSAYVCDIVDGTDY